MYTYISFWGCLGRGPSDESMRIIPGQRVLGGVQGACALGPGVLGEIQELRGPCGGPSRIRDEVGLACLGLPWGVKLTLSTWSSMAFWILVGQKALEF